VEVTFAICGKHKISLDDPRYCPECAAENEKQLSGKSGSKSTP
jgi:hypothetical protein